MKTKQKQYSKFTKSEVFILIPNRFTVDEIDDLIAYLEYVKTEMLNKRDAQ